MSVREAAAAAATQGAAQQVGAAAAIQLGAAGTSCAALAFQLLAGGSSTGPGRPEAALAPSSLGCPVKAPAGGGCPAKPQSRPQLRAASCTAFISVCACLLQRLLPPFSPACFCAFCR